MSTAPSSVPPPSFGLAPELPEGVERPPPPRGPRWKPWTAWVGAHRRLRRRAHGGAHRRRHRRRGGGELLRPHPGDEHLGDDRAGPVVHRRRPAVRGDRRPAAARAVRPAPARASGRPWAGWRSPSPPSTRSRSCGWRSWASAPTTPSSRRARRQGQHVRAAGGGLPGRGRGADGGGVLLPRLLLRRAAQLEGPVAGGDHHRRGVRGDPRRLGRGRLPAAAGVLRLRAVPAARAHRVAAIPASPCTA